MKKFLIMLAITLGVVACSKDSIETVEIDNSIEVIVADTSNKITIDQAYSFFTGLTGKEGSALKGNSAARNEDDKITVAFIAVGDENFAHLVSEDTETTFCYDNYTVQSFEYSYDSPSLFVYDLATNVKQTFTLSSGLTARYNAVFGQSLNNMQFIDYVNSNPTARLGSQPVRNDDGTFTAN